MAYQTYYLWPTRKKWPIVNFINVKHANFTYESLFSTYILALNELSYEKRAHKTLMKLTPIKVINEGKVRKVGTTKQIKGIRLKKFCSAIKKFLESTRSLIRPWILQFPVMTWVIGDLTHVLTKERAIKTLPVSNNH